MTDALVFPCVRLCVVCMQTDEATRGLSTENIPSAILIATLLLSFAKGCDRVSTPADEQTNVCFVYLVWTRIARKSSVSGENFTNKTTIRMQKGKTKKKGQSN